MHTRGHQWHCTPECGRVDVDILVFLSSLILMETNRGDMGAAEYHAGYVCVVRHARIVTAHNDTASL